MKDTVLRIRLMVLVVLSIGAMIVWTLPGVSEAHTTKYLTVSFLDVGQGDSIFIHTPSGTEVLVDGGPNSKVLRSLAQQMSFFDRDIDMVVGTHPDSDHIGGLIDVMQRYSVDTVLTTNNKSKSATAARYRQAIQDEGAKVILARTGQIFTIDDGIFLKVFFPAGDTTQMESNTSSIVVQLVYGDTEVLLTGDSPQRIEKYLVSQFGTQLESEVLKVGHHGSRTSTSELFLDTVNPQVAVISASKNSRYGHPHKEVMDILENHHIQTYNTADVGTITFESDGHTVWKR